MSKGSRDKNISENAAKAEQAQTSQNSIKRRKKIIISSVCAALAVAVAITGCCIGVHQNRRLSGYYLRHQICLKSDEYEINNAQLSYYFYKVYSDFISDHSSDLAAIGLTDGISLKTQKCYYDDDFDTWFDYFLAKAQAKLENAVCYASAAKDEGLQLDDGDKRDIDNIMNSFETAAQNSDKSIEQYLSDNLGEGVNEDDLRFCVELNVLAEKYYNKFESGLVYTDEQINGQYNSAPYKYNVVSYKSYEFDTEVSGAGDELKKLLNDAENNANALSGAKNEQEFDSILTEYLKKYYKAKNSDVSDSSIAKKIADLTTEDYSYVESSKLSKWAFDESRQLYDTRVFNNSDDGTITVYMLTKLQHKNEYYTKNVRHILATAESYNDDIADALTAVQSMLNRIIKSDDVEKAFIEYAEKYSEDTSSAKNGGLYENISKNETVKAFNDWCFYSGRKTGDTGVVLTNLGYHAMYFVGDGLQKWKKDVTDDMKLHDFETLIDDLKSKYNVSFLWDTANKLDK